VHLSWKLAALYGLYVTYVSQPAREPVRIRIGPAEWSALRRIVTVVAPLEAAAGCTARAVVQRLVVGGAFAYAAYSGAQSYAAIARAGRLYGAHDWRAARGPAAPAPDVVAASLFPTACALVAGPLGEPSLLDTAEEGGRAKVLQDRRRKASRVRGGGAAAGVKRGRTTTDDDGGGASSEGDSSSEHGSGGGGGGGSSGGRGNSATYVSPDGRVLSKGAVASIVSRIGAPRDEPAVARLREVGSMVHGTLGLPSRITPTSIVSAVVAASYAPTIDLPSVPHILPPPCCVPVAHLPLAALRPGGGGAAAAGRGRPSSSSGLQWHTPDSAAAEDGEFGAWYATLLHTGGGGGSSRGLALPLGTAGAPWADLPGVRQQACGAGVDLSSTAYDATLVTMRRLLHRHVVPPPGAAAAGWPAAPPPAAPSSASGRAAPEPLGLGDPAVRVALLALAASGAGDDTTPPVNT